MHLIGLHNAVSLMAGGPDESLQGEHGRLISDQNQLRHLVESLAKKLAKSSSGRKILDELTPDYVRRCSDERPPIPRHWPPDEVLLCRSKLDGSHLLEADHIRFLASETDAKWRSHNARMDDAENVLLENARVGALLLFYRDNGCLKWIAIPASVLQEILSVCRSRNSVQIWEAPAGPAHSTLSRSSIKSVYLNVHVDRLVIAGLIASRATDSVPGPCIHSVKSAALKLGTEEHRAWMVEYERIHENEKKKSLEHFRVCAFRDKFGNFPGLRRSLRNLRDQLGLQGKKGRPKKRH